MELHDDGLWVTSYNANNPRVELISLALCTEYSQQEELGALPSISIQA